ncbi:MAG: hypothetical protein JNM69_34705 [Archangium sp.]|nr:hypothetical protein [Archangium sp.]
MNRTEFKAFEAECVRLVSGNATATELTKAFSTLAKASPEEKVSAVLHFVDRDPVIRKRRGNGDWLAWYYVHGAVRGAQVLPWTRENLVHVLEGVVKECMVLPPEFVARAVGQFVKANGKPDAALAKLIGRAANSMWPPGSTEGVNFKKAAAKLRSLV